MTGLTKTVYFKLGIYHSIKKMADENKRSFSSMVNILCIGANKMQQENFDLVSSIHYLEKRIAILERSLQAPLADLGDMK